MHSLLTEYNPMLPDLNKFIRNRLPLLHSDCIKRGKNLREILSPSLFPPPNTEKVSKISKCNKKCDLCVNYMLFNNTFTCTANNRFYKIRGDLSCILYISCQSCKLQYSI